MMEIDEYGNKIVLGLAESQWPPVILFGACMLPSGIWWLVVLNFCFWYLLALAGRKLF